MSEHTMWEIEDSLGLRLICGVWMRQAVGRWRGRCARRR